jgi:serine/threonine protein kinase
MGLDMNDVVKICDFGFAREIVDPEKKLTGYVGTPIYMVRSNCRVMERFGPMTPW